MDYGKSFLSGLSAADTAEHKMETFLKVSETGPVLEALSETEQIDRIAQYLNGLDEIKLENWEQLTLQERTDILQHIENQTAELTDRRPLQVEVGTLPPGTRGEMDWANGKIRVSVDLVSSNNLSDLRQSVATLAHESRHAYQWSNLFDKRTEISDEKFDAWKVNIGEIGYVSAHRMGYQWYYVQPVEVDARVFAENVASKVSFR